MRLVCFRKTVWKREGLCRRHVIVFFAEIAVRLQTRRKAMHVFFPVLLAKYDNTRTRESQPRFRGKPTKCRVFWSSSRKTRHHQERRDNTHSSEVFSAGGDGGMPPPTGSIMWSDDRFVAVRRVGTAGHQALQVCDRGGDAEGRGRFREDLLDVLPADFAKSYTSTPSQVFPEFPPLRNSIRGSSKRVRRK